jgi:hypothetical protein
MGLTKSFTVWQFLFFKYIWEKLSNCNLSLRRVSIWRSIFYDNKSSVFYSISLIPDWGALEPELNKPKNAFFYWNWILFSDLLRLFNRSIKDSFNCIVWCFSLKWGFDSSIKHFSHIGSRNLTFIHLLSEHKYFVRDI